MLHEFNERHRPSLPLDPTRSEIRAGTSLPLLKEVRALEDRDVTGLRKVGAVFCFDNSGLLLEDTTILSKCIAVPRPFSSRLVNGIAITESVI